MISVKRFLIYIFSILFFLFSIKGFTQPGERGVQLLNNKPANEIKGKTYAVIIGISDYSVLTDLQFAHNDAKLFSRYLTSPAENVDTANIKMFLNQQATVNSFRVAGLNWLLNKKPKAGDRIFFFLAGHGDGYRNKYYFLSHETDTVYGPQSYRHGGSIELNELIEDISEYAEAGIKVYLIVDACRTNNSSGRRDSLMASRFSKSAASQVRNTHGLTIIYATKDGKPAFETKLLGNGQGLFTYFFVGGMMGKADQCRYGNKDNQVSLKELMDWLRDTVPSFSAKNLNNDQYPYECCDQDDREVIATVNADYLNTVSAQQMLMNDNETQKLVSAISKKHTSSRNASNLADPALNRLYDLFLKACNQGRLMGEKSANEYLIKIRKLDKKGTIQEQAEFTLMTELLNAAQKKINIFLKGEDFEFRKTNKIENENDLLSTTFIELTRISRLSFSEVAAYLQLAMELVSNENIKRLIQPSCLFAKARSYYDKTAISPNLDTAIQYAKSALQMDSSAVYIHQLIGILEMEKDASLAKSEMLLTQTAITDTAWSRATLDLGYLYFKKHQYSLAQKFYRIGLRLNSTSPYLYNNIAVLMEQQKQYDSADIYYTKAIKLSPRNSSFKYNTAVFYNKRGLELRNMNRQTEAASFFSKAIMTDSSLFISYNNLGNLYASQGQAEKAKGLYQTAVRKDTTNANSYFNLGVLYMNVNEYAAAYRCFQKTYTKDTLGLLTEKISQCLTRLEKEAHFPNFLLVSDVNEKALGDYNLAMLSIGNREYEKAERAFKKAHQLQPGSKTILNDMAAFYLAWGKPEIAEGYLLQCLQYNAANRNAGMNLAAAYEMQKKYAQAETIYKRFFAMNNRDEEAVGKLYALYLKMDNRKEADVYRQILYKLQ